MTSAPRPFSPFDTLLPYQRAWVADAARFKLALWSRQIGKSYATGFEAVTDCGANPGERGGGGNQRREGAGA